MKCLPRVLAGLLIAILGGGCATSVHRDVNVGLADDLAEARERIAQLEHASSAQLPTGDAPAYLGEPMPLEPLSTDPDLPPVFRETFTYAQAGSGTLQDAAHFLALQAGIQIRLTPDAAALGSDQPRPLPINSEAPLAHLLDELTLRSGTSWRWTGRQVLIFLRDVRTFRLHAVPPAVETNGTITNASNSGSAGGGGGSGGGSGESGGSSSSVTTGNAQSTSVSYVFNVFADTLSAVQAMLSEGSSASASPSSGSLVVRGTASELATVAAYIEDVNAQLTRQVVIELTVLTIDQADESNLQANVNILHQTLGGDLASALTGNGGAGLAAAGTTFGTTVVRNNSPFAGSSLIVDALRTATNASVRRRNVITTLDNQPTRVQSVVERGYEAGSETTLVPDVGSQTTIRLGTQTTGFSLTLLPVVLDGETILLQVQGGLSIPLERRRVTNSGGTAELLTTSMDDFLQRARLRVGETLVLTGLDQVDRGSTEQGTGNARFKLFGGASKARDARRMMVIMLTVRSVG